MNVIDVQRFHVPGLLLAAEWTLSVTWAQNDLITINPAGYRLAGKYTPRPLRVGRVFVFGELPPYMNDHVP